MHEGNTSKTQNMGGGNVNVHCRNYLEKSLDISLKYLLRKMHCQIITVWQNCVKNALQGSFRKIWPCSHVVC